MCLFVRIERMENHRLGYYCRRYFFIIAGNTLYQKWTAVHVMRQPSPRITPRFKLRHGEHPNSGNIGILQIPWMFAREPDSCCCLKNLEPKFNGWSLFSPWFDGLKFRSSNFHWFPRFEAKQIWWLRSIMFDCKNCFLDDHIVQYV